MGDLGIWARGPLEFKKQPPLLALSEALGSFLLSAGICRHSDGHKLQTPLSVLSLFHGERWGRERWRGRVAVRQGHVSSLVIRQREVTSGYAFHGCLRAFN